MEYTVVVRLSITMLVKIVNDLITSGWIPHGNLVTYADEYLQPMVRYAPTPEPEPVPPDTL